MHHVGCFGTPHAKTARPCKGMRVDWEIQSRPVKLLFRNSRGSKKIQPQRYASLKTLSYNAKADLHATRNVALRLPPRDPPD